MIPTPALDFYRLIDAVPNARLGVRIGIANERASKALIPSVTGSGLSGASPTTHVSAKTPHATPKGTPGTDPAPAGPESPTTISPGAPLTSH